MCFFVGPLIIDWCDCLVLADFVPVILAGESVLPASVFSRLASCSLVSLFCLPASYSLARSARSLNASLDRIPGTRC